MRRRQLVSTKQFVVHARGARGAQIGEELSDLGEVERVNGGELTVLRLRRSGREVKATWAEICRRIRGDGWAAPVLMDDQGHEQLPTGTLSVRFVRALSDEQLTEFAARHELCVRQRNEFVREQATFEPLVPCRTYLPDLVASIQRDPEVAAAWANTLSRYRRTAGS